ncbi:DUF4256 domain-containing protein [Leptothrix discophora]|uniref:DUF4256 domain-containing protein n=1 Tax=Leptothrix discophora TaxID=89 RepID=A0ABT9FYS5_LEPDI|nr:DUF4256 domain-containing protein [Leptothrix discophora]MDP4299391.1 DUF4256 domain-containing protein [Leptothrix discophora]
MPDPTDEDLLALLQTRHATHRHRHAGIAWVDVRDRLAAHPRALPVLRAMEASGGEPDVVGIDEATGAIVYCDCSPESPAGRRSLCFDRQALDARKENKPAGNVEERAAALGIELLTEAQYRALQALEPVDRKTSSWIRTPPAIRALGGALFCDRRYDQVFTYHNGAESYYAARGFRGRLLLA